MVLAKGGGVTTRRVSSDTVVAAKKKGATSSAATAKAALARKATPARAVQDAESDYDEEVVLPAPLEGTGIQLTGTRLIERRIGSLLKRGGGADEVMAAVAGLCSEVERLDRENAVLKAKVELMEGGVCSAPMVNLQVSQGKKQCTRALQGPSFAEVLRSEAVSRREKPGLPEQARKQQGFTLVVEKEGVGSAELKSQVIKEVGTIGCRQRR